MRKWTLAVTALAALGLLGCKQQRSEPAGDEAEPAAEAQAPAAQPERIEWIHDDYPAALARAKKEKKPLVIDMWAPWCHTCLSMQQVVLSDPGLTPMAGRFVFLSLDTDKKTNAKAVGKFPVHVWPTFYVVSPVDESVQARQLGATTVDQFRDFLTQGEKGDLETRAATGKLARNSLLWHVRDGDRASAAGDPKAAADAYRLAIEAAPDDYVRLPDLLVSTISALHEQKDWKACADFADKHSDHAEAGNTAAMADFAYFASECANKLDDKDRGRILLGRLSQQVGRVLDARDSALSVDDRSYALEMRRELALALGDDKLAKQSAEAQRDLLNHAYDEAPNPHAAMTYGWHLAEVNAYLGEPEKAVPRLKKLCEELPDEYDPPHRLAWIYLKMGEHDKALARAKQALERVYGPRKARIQRLIADIHHARGDRDAEIAARKAVVDIYEKLPDGQKAPEKLETAKKKLAELSGS